MPTTTEALTLARQYFRAGQRAPAEQLCRQILQADPASVDALRLLGLLAHQAGNLAQAIACYHQALRWRPELAEVHNSLGAALAASGQLPEALGSFQEAVRLQPDYVEAQDNLGSAFKLLGRRPEAEASYRQALRLRPDFAQAHSHLGVLLAEQGQLLAALASFQEALRYRPDPLTYTRVAAILRYKLRQPDEALAACRQALALQPDSAEAHYMLGIIFRDTALLDESLAALRRAVELNPASAAYHSDLVYTLHFQEGSTSAVLAAEARRWHERHAAPLADQARPHPNAPDPERRLRVGYVSPDFVSHPVGRFLLPLLEAHDKSRMEVFCYSSGTDADETTERLRSGADCWRDVAGWSDEALARQVREDRIDVLVDLSAHMANHRLLVFARKPAPVQVTYLAYCSTTGLGAIDYRLTDPYLDPLPLGNEKGVGSFATAKNAENVHGPELPTPFSLQGYAEHSVWLPETYWCYRPVIEVAEGGPLPALGAGHVNFGCLNNFCKATGPTLALWRELLRRVPEARLLLHAHAGGHRERVRDFFAAGGIAAQRLAFVETLPLAEYFALYRRIDVALDPYPYGGGTTTCDALWMGVPVVSLVGQTAVSRAGWSILSNVGLPELVARTPEEYLGIAAGLAGDLSSLEQLRGSLRARMQRSPLTDAARFARHVEAAYRAMWQRWCDAVRLRSDLPEFHNDQGVALAEQGRFSEAEASFRAALRLRPEFAQAWHNLGIALAAQEKPEEAEACYEQALRLRPDCPETLNELGLALVAQAKVDAALACQRKAVALNPTLHYIYSDLLMTLQYSSAYDPEATFAEHLGWAEQFQGLSQRPPPSPPTPLPLSTGGEGRSSASFPSPLYSGERGRGEGVLDPNRRLRIGYVSGDFREHVLGRLSEAIITAHDRSQFEIFCYANVRREDDRTGRLKGLAEHWRSVVPLSDEQAAELIRADRIDLLIDLSGHTGRNRLGVFARKPAPIQVSYYGYQASTGLAAIDYRLTDAYCDPPGMTEHLHTEKLVRVPDLQWCYAPGPCPDVGPLPAQRAGEVTFGSFNNLPKVTDDMIGLWARILAELPAARMILLTGAGRAADERVLAAFGRHGVLPQRVTLVGKRPREAYLRLYHDVDICLDTYPYCGNTTTADALWMGVPVVTRAGRTWLTRQGVGILTQTGLAHLVAETPEAYVETAVRLAQDLPRLRELRAQLRCRVQQTLGHVKRCVGQLEAAYRRMWQEYCNESNPASGPTPRPSA